MGGEGVSPQPPQRSAHRWSQGAWREFSGAARHACRIAVGPSPAAPGLGCRPRPPSKGGRAGRRRGRRRGERRATTGARKGRRWRPREAAALPVAREAEGLPEDLVHAVPGRPWPSAAEGVGPQRRGVDLPGLRRDGPPHVADRGEDGVDGVGHVPPRHLGPRAGGRLAGGVVVPDPAPPVHPNGVVPPGGRRPLEEGEAAARAEEPAGGGVVPLLHAAGPGLPPQRLARFLPPHGGEVLAPRVREAAAAEIRPGGARKEDLGVPPLQGLAHSGPLGPELGATREIDGGDPYRPILWPVTAVPPSVPGPRQEVLEPQDPGEQADEGGQGAGRVGPAPLLGAVREHQGGLAVPPANQGEAVVPPLVFREGGRGGRGRASAPSPAAAPTSTSSWSTCHMQNSRAVGRQGARPGRWGQGVWVGGRAACIPRPPGSPGRQRTLPAGFIGVRRPPRGGMGGGGAGGGRGGAPATVLATPGAMGSRRAAVAAPPTIPPTPHCSAGSRATARAGPRARGGPSAIASPWGALVGCGRIDTLQPGRGSGHWGHSRRESPGLVPPPYPPPPAPGVSSRAPERLGSPPPPPPRRVR